MRDLGHVTIEWLRLGTAGWAYEEGTDGGANAQVSGFGDSWGVWELGSLQFTRPASHRPCHSWAAPKCQLRWLWRVSWPPRPLDCPFRVPSERRRRLVCFSAKVWSVGFICVITSFFFSCIVSYVYINVCMACALFVLVSSLFCISVIQSICVASYIT